MIISLYRPICSTMLISIYTILFLSHCVSISLFLFFSPCLCISLNTSISINLSHFIGIIFNLIVNLFSSLPFRLILCSYLNLHISNSVPYVSLFHCVPVNTFQYVQYISLRFSLSLSLSHIIFISVFLNYYSNVLSCRTGIFPSMKKDILDIWVKIYLD